MIKRLLIVGAGLGAILAALVSDPAAARTEPAADDPQTVCGVCW
ncbi:hypothetical protein [Kribbella amoyensis]|nr:hypothetical protein [Kribbella amoyensis]